MKLQGITICKGFGDYLAESMVRNFKHFDRYFIVTHPEDAETQKICSAFENVVCIQTDCMHEGGARFNKGLAINFGLSQMNSDGWILHIDADVVLPANFRDRFNQMELDENCIYGADRHYVVGFEQWLEWRDRVDKMSTLRFDCDAAGYLHQVPNELPNGGRFISEFGYVPLGYFQLWHSKFKRVYPGNCVAADRSDVLFASQWGRGQRQIILETAVYHLTTQPITEMGADWSGRTSARFENDRLT